MAAALGCVGIEVRNDLPQPLFDGMDPADGGRMARRSGLRLLAVAEVKRFNDWSDAKRAEALALMQIAQAAGAEAVSLIPRNDNLGMGNGERQAAPARGAEGAEADAGGSRPGRAWSNRWASRSARCATRPKRSRRSRRSAATGTLQAGA